MDDALADLEPYILEDIHALADLEAVLFELSKSGGSLALKSEDGQVAVHVMMSDGETNDLHAKDIEPVPCPNLKAAIAKACETVWRERGIERRIEIEVARRVAKRLARDESVKPVQVQ